MKVLSLFDGYSSGLLALDMVGIKVDKYYSSEICKDAIAVSEHYFKSRIERLGDVEGIDLDSLGEIDLILAGSPCTGFSFAGKQLNFQDPQSRLISYFFNAVEKLKPKHFLLENVPMKKEYLDIISNGLGVKPVKINSKLVSAQSRNRYYWANFPITQPEDKNILLRDILKEDGMPFNYSSSGRGNGVVEGRLNQADKALTLTKTGYTRRAFTGVFDPKTLKSRHLYTEEKELLQGLPVDFTLPAVSRTKREKLIGNGWNIETIVHIFKGVKDAP
jgi:site-specific DNA-cytosine methylase